MDLTAIFPEQPKFKIGNKEYHLRIPNLEDAARFNEILGNDQAKVNEIFQKLQWPLISKLIYRILVEKKDFLASEETAINDDGVETTTLVTGPTKLMRCLSNAEALAMVDALVKAMELSNPPVDKEAKKKQAVTPLQSTGP
jgi:hypothetical protein